RWNIDEFTIYSDDPEWCKKEFSNVRHIGILEDFEEMQNYEAQRKKIPNLVAPRRDLELDALVEILNKERFITCHSYVQSEITDMMRVAEKFGFTLNTFTHILEGYTV
ncbi:MAG: hypothetical protein ACK55I_04870, partial [bacterium]